jgi:hypothetical protein
MPHVLSLRTIKVFFLHDSLVEPADPPVQISHISPFSVDHLPDKGKPGVFRINFPRRVLAASPQQIPRPSLPEGEAMFAIDAGNAEPLKP